MVARAAKAADDKSMSWRRFACGAPTVPSMPRTSVPITTKFVQGFPPAGAPPPKPV